MTQTTPTKAQVRGYWRGGIDATRRQRKAAVMAIVDGYTNITRQQAGYLVATVTCSSGYDCSGTICYFLDSFNIDCDRETCREMWEDIKIAVVVAAPKRPARRIRYGVCGDGTVVALPNRKRRSR